MTDEEYDRIMSTPPKAGNNGSARLRRSDPKRKGSSGRPPNKINAEDTEAKLLRLIYGFARERGCCPSLRWIANRMGWASVNACTQHIQSLADRGLLSWWPVIGDSEKRLLRLPGVRFEVTFTDDAAGTALRAALAKTNKSNTA